MKAMVSKKANQRILAAIMACVMLFSLIYTSSPSAAETETQSTGVTVTVVDENGASVAGANVEYTITSTSENKTVKGSSGTTDDKGLLEVLTADEYNKYPAGDLKISATVSKADYEGATISETVITSASQKINATIKSNKITGVTVEKNDLKYNGTAQELVSVSGTKADDTVTYKLDNGEFSTEVPKATAVGTYKVTVKVERTGYDAFEQEVSVDINKGVITDKDIAFKGYEGIYDEMPHAAVTVSGNLNDGKNTITYEVQEKDQVKKYVNNIPEFTNAGNYIVNITVDRDNYDTYKTSANVKIDVATINGIKIEANKLTYKGEEQELIKIENADGYTVRFKMDGKNEYTEYRIDENGKSNIPKATNAGTYNIDILIEKENYKPYNTTITTTIDKADRNATFSTAVYNTDELLSFRYNTKNEDDNKKVFSIKVGEDKLEGETIEYGIVNNGKDDNGDNKDDEEIGDIAEIDKNGNVTLKKGGYILKVTATIAASKNYKETNKSKEFAVVADDNELQFENVEYVLGTNNGKIADLSPKKLKYKTDAGEYVYTFDTESSEVVASDGIKIDKDTVSVDDYSALIEEMLKNNDSLTKKISVKYAGKKTSKDDKNKKYQVYADCTASFDVNISFEEINNIDKTYQIKPATSNNNWYKEDVSIMVTAGISIAKETVNKKADNFEKKIVYDENDQGKQARIFYLRFDNNGGIAKPITRKDIWIDEEKPENVNVEYVEAVQSTTISKIENIINEAVKHYYGGPKNKPVKVTFSAMDPKPESGEASGIKGFEYNYSYVKDGSIENINKKIIITDNGNLVDENGDEVENATKTEEAGEVKVTVNLDVYSKETEGDIISVSALDVAGNQTIYTDKDNNKFIYDVVSPVMNVSYVKDGEENKDKYINEENNVVYTNSGKLKFNIQITETYFYGKDVNITIKGGEYEEGKWTNENNIHSKSLFLSGKGTYSISISYADRSANQATTYTKTIIIDQAAPTVKFDYHDGKEKAIHYYKEDEIKIDVSVNDEHFKDNTEFVVKYNGKKISSRLYTIDKSNANNGQYSITLPKNEGEYVITVNNTDKCGNAVTATSEKIIADKNDPEIQIEYLDGNNNKATTINPVKARVKITERYFDENNTHVYMLEEDYATNSKRAEEYKGTVKDELKDILWKNDGDKHYYDINLKDKNSICTFCVKTTDKSGRTSDSSSGCICDTTDPTLLAVSYSKAGESPAYYDGQMQVTISAKDDVSGIEEFEYTLVKYPGSSDVNKVTTFGTAKASHTGNNMFSATITISPQFDGYVEFTARDIAKNSSTYSDNNKRIIVDSKAPTSNITFNTPVQNVGGTSYYDGNITGTININEANFDANDVTVRVTKDGASYPASVSWSNGSVDSHTGTLTLSEDGDYTVSVAGKDKSGNEMTPYTSEQLTIDTDIKEPVLTVNGSEADGKAFKDKVIPAVKFEDTNLDSYEITLLRTRYGEKNVDVTKDFIKNHMSVNMGTGVGEGEFDEFAKIQDNDGIYTLKAKITDKAGHESEKEIVFTVNRYGSIYVYDDYLVDLIADGGAYVQSIDKDLIITEYNPDKLVSQSLNVEISKDGKPLEIAAPAISPEINDRVTTGSSGWYQYQYTISKDNFAADGIYKIVVSSKDETGNNPQNTNYEDKTILFRVDSTAPEINSITGLENKIINATGVTVKYTIFDTISLASVDVYVNGEKVESVSDFGDDFNNYSGEVQLKESSSEQSVRIVATDKAGNVTDTDSSDFTSAYKFNSKVTVSTNVFVRWFANKLLFFGSIAGVLILIGGVSFLIVVLKRRKKKTA